MSTIAADELLAGGSSTHVDACASWSVDDTTPDSVLAVGRRYVVPDSCLSASCETARVAMSRAGSSLVKAASAPKVKSGTEGS